MENWRAAGTQLAAPNRQSQCQNNRKYESDKNEQRHTTNNTLKSCNFQSYFSPNVRAENLVSRANYRSHAGPLLVRFVTGLNGPEWSRVSIGITFHRPPPAPPGGAVQRCVSRRANVPLRGATND